MNGNSRSSGLLLGGTRSDQEPSAVQNPRHSSRPASSALPATFFEASQGASSLFDFRACGGQHGWTGVVYIVRMNPFATRIHLYAHYRQPFHSPGERCEHPVSMLYLIVFAVLNLPCRPPMGLDAQLSGVHLSEMQMNGRGPGQYRGHPEIADVRSLSSTH